MTFTYRLWAGVSDTLSAALFGTLTWFFLFLIGQERLHSDPWGWVWLACALAWIVAFWLLRWGGLQVDGSGITRFRCFGRSRLLIPWGDLQEVFEEGENLVVKGVRNTIRVDNRFDRVERAKGMILERALPVVRARVEQEWDEKGFVVFRTRSAWSGHVLYVIAGLVLAALGSFGAYMIGFHGDVPFFESSSILVVAALLLMLGIFFLQVRRAAAWRGGWVAAGPEGLLVHRLDGEKRVTWGELDEVDCATPGWVVLRRKSGMAVRLPRSMGNREVLLEVIRERMRLQPAAGE